MRALTKNMLFGMKNSAYANINISSTNKFHVDPN